MPDKPQAAPRRPARRQPGVRRPVRRRSRLRARGRAARPRAPDRAEPEPEPAAVQPDADEDAVTAEVVAPSLALDASPRPKTEYRLPAASILKTSTASRGGGEDHKQVARKLVEALANFGVEARVRRHGGRPARDPLRAAARPGHQGEPRHPAARRPGLRARDHRDPHPRADPGQAGGRRRGAQHLAQPRHARRHLRRAGGRFQPAHRLARQGHLRAPAWPATWPRCRTC